MPDATNPIIKVIDLVPGEICELPSVQAEDLTQQVFWQDYVCKHLPLIIKQGAGHWPAASKWGEPGYLESIPSDGTGWISPTFNPRQLAVLKKVVQVKKARDCIREMREAPDDHTYSMPGIPVYEEWKKDIGDYAFISRDKFAKPPRNYDRQRMFAYKNAATDWHYHPTDETLTTQLSGKKRFSLFRLDDSNWDECINIIEPNLHHLSCAKQLFPPNLSLVKYEAILSPGDVIYIPPFWWHGVDPADSMVGVTLADCFRTPWHRLGNWNDPVTCRATASKKHREGFRASLAQKFMIALSSMIRSYKGNAWHEKI